jgi:hypothetical protein
MTAAPLIVAIAALSLLFGAVVMIVSLALRAGRARTAQAGVSGSVGLSGFAAVGLGGSHLQTLFKTPHDLLLLCAVGAFGVGYLLIQLAYTWMSPTAVDRPTTPTMTGG